MRRKPERMIELTDALIVAFSDIENAGLVLPPEKCAFCRQPAVYMLCGCVPSNEKYADYEPKDLRYRALIIMLRSEFETNFEMPVCEAHSNGLTQ